MEEELNENDLEDRMYAMLHHVDESQANVTEHSQNNEALRIVESTPSSTVRRYWRQDAGPPRSSLGLPPAEPSPFVKINTPAIKTKPKHEEQVTVVTVSEPSIDSLFQSNPSQNLKTSIEFIDYDNEVRVLELESSDDDEVIEVALPPKPTITIESSDEEVVTTSDSPPKISTANIVNKKSNGERAVSASPVPSVVSSVSDDFIRGDCIALNISSKCSDNHSFDFSLHGSDLLVQDTPSKKKRRKKNKESPNASTSIVATSTPASAGSNRAEECFATPRSKSSKKQKSKAYSVQENSVTQIDIYDSDSNQSIETTKKLTSYVVSEKSFPSIDVYESDSSQPESVTNISMLSQQKLSNIESKSPESSDSGLNKTSPEQAKPTKQRATEKENNSVLDLTDNMVTFERLPKAKAIEENFVMANVTGFNDCDDYTDNNQTDTDPGQFGSTKIPAILNEHLDFDNLKGTDKFSSKRKFSAAALRVEMEKFYNESWGGENFNHREIQKRMSKDKSLWKIDPRDRIPTMQTKKKTVCQYCNRAGHRDDRCWRRVPVCHMCGAAGHFEPRCPRKICMNCGAPSELYSASCRQCRAWRALTCAECGQRGHPRAHCPDLWRRYHATVEASGAPTQATGGAARATQPYCSGCARRGHLVHACRTVLPFSALPIYSPYVFNYAPVLPPAAPPAPREPSPAPPPAKRPAFDNDANCSAAPEAADDASPAPDAASSNRDKRGRIIQDNAVSATSDALPSAAPPAGPPDDPPAVARDELPPDVDLPRNRFDLIRKLSRALESLKEDLGDPKAIYKELTYLLARQERLRRCRVVSPRRLANGRGHIEAARRRLNAVLLGQAGLAGGGAHVAQLAALAARLAGLRRHHVPPAVRTDLARHYAAVFSAVPRDDYADLLQQYYCGPTPATLAPRQPAAKSRRKRKKNKAGTAPAQPCAATQCAALPPPAPATPKNPRREAQRADAAPPPAHQVDPRPLVRKTMQKLLFVHRRLVQTHIADSVLKKRRLSLVRVLNSQIASLQKSEKMSSKSIKKMKKTHTEAQTFLKNV